MPIPNYKRLGGAASAAAAEGLVVFREKPLQLDSAGLVWQLKYTPDPQYVWPVLNGVELDPYYPTGASQFTLDGNVLTLAEPVIPSDSDDWWWVWYFRKGKKGGSGNRSGKARQFGAPADVGGPGTAVALGRMAGNVWLQARLVPNLATPLMAGNSLQIGSAGTYSVVNTLNNSNPYELKAGPMPLWALIDAINGDASNGAAGVWFSSATPPNQDVVASITSGGILLQVIAGAVDGSITVDMGGTGGRIQITLPDSNTTYYPSVTLTGGYMLDGDTVTIGSVTYTFKGSLGFD